MNGHENCLNAVFYNFTSARDVSYSMLWHHVWAISAAITVDKLWIHPISHGHRRVSDDTYYVVSGILSEESVAGLSCPIYVQISSLYLLMWTGPFEWILIMLSVFSLENSSTGLSCSISFLRWAPTLRARVPLFTMLLHLWQRPFKPGSVIVHFCALSILVLCIAVYEHALWLKDA